MLTYRSLSYHWMRTTLFNFLKPLSSSSDSPDIGERISQYAREQCIASARIIAGLHSRYIHDYGSRNLTIWMPQTALSTAYLLIDDLKDPEIQDIFHEVCVVLVSISRRWYVMRGHVRMLYITIEQSGKVMPDRTRQIMGRIAVDAWRHDDHKSFDGSVYPNYALARSEDPRAAGMGELLEHWASSAMQVDTALTTSTGGDSDGVQSTSSGRDASEGMSMS